MSVLITLLICGAVLLVLESVLPGMILGIVGICCWIGAIIYSYSSMGDTAGHYTVGGVLFLGIGGFIFWLKYFPTSPMGKLFVSESHVGDMGEKPVDMVGASGVATSRLSPSGFARINGKKVDVIASEGFLDQGTPIVVIDVSGNRIVVRESESTEDSLSQA